MSDRETAYRVPWKWRIGILVVSLLFTIIFLGATSEFRDALFVQPALATIAQAKSLERVATIHEEAEREAWLGNVYALFGLLVGLGMPAAAALLTRFVRTRRALLGGMMLAGLAAGVLLGAVYALTHLAVLSGGVQDPWYLPALVAAFFFISLFDGLLVGALAHKAGAGSPAGA